MKLPDIKNKKAIYMESREARVVQIRNIALNANLVEIELELLSDIPHMRIWFGDEPYVKLMGDSSYKLSCAKDLIVLDKDFAQCPMSGWQLFIDEESVNKFIAKDDAWTEEWF